MTTTNMMSSAAYLEAAVDNGASMGRGGVEGAEVSWMNGIGATPMSYAGLDASPYAAESPATLKSPETSSIDHGIFPSPVGDFSYFDPSFGGFSSGPAYGIPGDVPAGQLPLHMGQRRAAAAAVAGYGITSAPNQTLYAPGGGAGIWPTHASPTPFLPTPPMADDLSDDGSAHDDDYDDEHDASPEPPKRRRAVRAAPPAAATSSSSSSASGRARKRSSAQLRTASRAPRKKPNTLPQRPTETVEDVKAREAHNQVEQQYRKRLNAHFERLLSVLPAPGAASVGGGRRDGIGEKRVSKAEVLDLATERIRALERQTARLERERRELRGRLAGCVV